MTAEHKDFFVAETKDKDLANLLRLEICRKYQRVWVCVINQGDLYKVSIANHWAGRLEKTKEDSIAEFSKQYMDNSQKAGEKKTKKSSKTTTVEVGLS